MKWNGKGFRSRGIKALGVSLAVGLGMTACSRDYTAAYVYATAATKTSTGVVDAFAVDYLSGALTPLADTGITSGGNNPVGLVASPNQKFLYVINQTAPTSNVAPFSIGTDGKLYALPITDVVQNSSGTLVGSAPTSVAIDPSGSFLFVTFHYEDGYTTAHPGPGGVAVFPIKSDGTLGSPVMNGALPYFLTGNNPSGIVVTPKTSLATRYVYVIDQEKPSSGSPYGVLLTFTENTSTGALTLIPGPVPSGQVSGIGVGTTPAGIAEDPTGSYLYVTDATTNELYAFLANGATTGTPKAIISAPYSTGDYPEGVTVDPRGLYVYTANYGSSTVGAYAINQATGALSSVAGSAGVSVATGPTCVTIEPALGIYLYTSNNLDNSVSGEKLNANTGALSEIQGSQFPASALPTCIVSVANGAHATQLVD
jgi:6-phosphogluconolactonase (cycloisomerase 2 family)